MLSSVLMQASKPAYLILIVLTSAGARTPPPNRAKSTDFGVSAGTPSDSQSADR